VSFSLWVCLIRFPFPQLLQFCVYPPWLDQSQQQPPPSYTFSPKTLTYSYLLPNFAFSGVDKTRLSKSSLHLSFLSSQHSWFGLPFSPQNHFKHLNLQQPHHLPLHCTFTCHLTPFATSSLLATSSTFGI